MKKSEKIIRIIAVSLGEALSCGTIVFLYKSGNGERLLLAFGTVLFVLLPGILERLLRCKINTLIYVFAVIYTLGPMMGHCWKFYYVFLSWDKLLHICAGVLFVILGVYLFQRLSQAKTNYLSAVIFALCFSMAISMVWEFIEYGADCIFGTDMQDDRVVRSITSYLLGTEKGVTGSISGIRSVAIDGTPLPLEGYIDIGLHDTMLDMLLESGGALAACALIFADRGKHPLIISRHWR